jgi:hypothetical protein
MNPGVIFPETVPDIRLTGRAIKKPLMGFYADPG